MLHDPAQIKPQADYPKRTLADDAFDQKVKPAIHIVDRYPKRKVLPPRSWMYKQLMPIIKRGHVNNATYAVYLLNMSNLPNSSTPRQCLMWVETFLELMNSLNDREEAAKIADKAVLRAT